MIFVPVQYILQRIIPFAGIPDDAPFEFNDILGVDENLQIKQFTNLISRGFNNKLKGAHTSTGM
jgi:hypothetical protein